jgi:hypothetical protein
MAESYNRRINLYINVDGKEVQNNVKSIRGELAHLVNAQNQMTIGSEEYRKQTMKIQQLKSVLKGHAEAIGQIQTPMQKAISTAKQLLPAMGFTAIAAGAKMAFDKVVNSTDVLSTKWAVFTGGLQSGMNEFWRTIAVGDWSNFTENMRAAIKVGREYETMLDDVEEKTRALRIKEAQSRGEELRLEEALKNTGLSKSERLAAGQARIKLDEDLAKERVKIAQDTFDAEMAVTMQQTRLSKERLMEVVSDMDSETKIKAKAYLEQQSLYESTLKKNDQFKVAASRSGITENPFAKEIADSKAILDSYPESVKVYAEAIKGVGSTTDEQLNKMVTGYEGLLSAINSGAENTKRVRTMVNSLLAGKEGDGNPTTPTDPASAKTATDALDLAYKQQTLLLKQKYADEETLQKEYAARMLAAEIAYMQTKLELTTDESSQIDLQSQLIDKQLQYAAALKETIPEILNTDNGIQKLNTRLLEESKLLDLAAQKQAEGTAAQETATAKQIQQADTIKMVGDVMTDYVTGALNGSLDGFQTFGDTLILMSLQMLKQMVPIWSAQILGLSLSSPESVASWGVAGLAKYAVVTGLMYAGIAAVEGVVKNGIEGRKNAEIPGHAAGGYTNGAGVYIAGEKGPEWIAPNSLLRNPYTSSIIAGLEDMRRNPVSVTSGAFAITKQFSGSMFQNTTGSQTAGSRETVIQTTSDPELKTIMAENTKAIRELMRWKPKVTTELIKKDIDTLNHIEQNRGL